MCEMKKLYLEATFTDPSVLHQSYMHALQY